MIWLRVNLFCYNGGVARVEPISGTAPRPLGRGVPLGPDSAVGRSLSIARQSAAERRKSLDRASEQLRIELNEGSRQKVDRPAITDQNGVVGLDVLA